MRIKHFLFLLVWCLPFPHAYGQYIGIGVDSLSLEGTWNLQNGRFSIDWQAPDSSMQKRWLKDLKASISGRDLVIQYTPVQTRKHIRFVITPILYIAQQYFPPKPNTTFEKAGLLDPDDHDLELRIVWRDLIKLLPSGQGIIKLVLLSEAFAETPIQLSKKPKFNFGHVIPHLILQGIGTYGILHGRSLQDEAEQIYQESYLTKLFEVNAQSYYDLALEKRQQGNQFVGLGIAISAADLLYMGYQYYRLIKKSNVYKIYYGADKVTWKPIIYLGTPLGRYTGFKVQLKF